MRQFCPTMSVYLILALWTAVSCHSLNQSNPGSADCPLISHTTWGLVKQMDSANHDSSGVYVRFESPRIIAFDHTDTFEGYIECMPINDTLVVRIFVEYKKLDRYDNFTISELLKIKKQHKLNSYQSLNEKNSELSAFLRKLDKVERIIIERMAGKIIMELSDGVLLCFRKV